MRARVVVTSSSFSGSAGSVRDVSSLFIDVLTHRFWPQRAVAVVVLAACGGDEARLVMSLYASDSTL